MHIVLASGSPRRHELLTRAQLDFSVMSVDVDETPYDNEHPKDYIERMVAAKAQAAIQKINTDEYQDKAATANSPIIILTADTIGVLSDGNTVLIKPTDREHAYSMWQQMSDNTHQVWTAVQATKITPCSTENNSSNLNKMTPETSQSIVTQQIIECTDVTFIPLTSAMMSNYWNSGEPADKAGGYGIQGLAAAWVARINGSYTNVVGLPLAQTLALIDKISEL